VIALAPDAETAVARSEQVHAELVEEYGLDADAVDVSLSCAPAGSDCPVAGATVTVTVATRVPLPLVPSLVGLDRSTAVLVEASAAQKISRLWGGG
jgi:hypothetical protein